MSDQYPEPVPDPLDDSNDTEETAEISSDVEAAPYPYGEPGSNVQDDGSDPDADLG